MTQLTSLIVEGVFARHPNLRWLMLESGFTWWPVLSVAAAQVLARVRMETPGRTARR